MTLHVDHPLVYDDALIASRVVKREKKAKRTALAFGIALLLAIPVWLAFLAYL